MSTANIDGILRFTRLIYGIGMSFFGVILSVDGIQQHQENIKCLNDTSPQKNQVTLKYFFRPCMYESFDTEIFR